MKLCTFCTKPIKKKGHLCGSCVSIMNQINQSREKVTKNGDMKKGVAYKISQRKVKFLIDHVIKSYDSDLILRWFNELHYYDWFTYIPTGSHVARQHKKNVREKNHEYVGLDKKIPKDVSVTVELPYIPLEFKKSIHFNQELVKVSGTFAKPIVIVKCKSCGEEYACKFSDFKVGKFEHHCRATISSGELAVENWLKSHKLSYKTQFNTFKVINPHTKHQLPFDFELANSKVIIEVHGDQHYKFTPRFHQTIENFQYQQWKDKYKRKHAERNGYKYIELNYKQIKTGTFKEVLSNLTEIR
ncbi:hypothetical protein CN918_30040 [Priestia megaterium]|nr:hypothetical protein CN918_30040 [Priestia megaterium]